MGLSDITKESRAVLLMVLVLQKIVITLVLFNQSPNILNMPGGELLLLVVKSCPTLPMDCKRIG